MTRRRETRWSDLGRVPYAEAAQLQVEIREALARKEGPERLLLLEHPHVYTLGRNASPKDVLLDSTDLAVRGVSVVESDRGGQVTYHGPGQLVGYPILDLNPDRRDLRRYVDDLQQVLVRLLAEVDVVATGGEGERIGIWVGERKIASIGIHLARWRTTHGFALNIDPDLRMFGGIVACGLPAVEMTSIRRETGSPTDSNRLLRRLVEHFAAVFDRELVEDPELTRAVRRSEVSA